MFDTAAEHEPRQEEECQFDVITVDGRITDTFPIGYRHQIIGKHCPICGSTNTHPTDGTRTAPVTIVRGNSDFAERQSERLYKRSNEHYKREGRDEAIERQRKVFEGAGIKSDDKVAEVV